MTKQFQPLAPAALYARVSSDRQDVDLSVAAQLRARRDYADKNGYLGSAGTSTRPRADASPIGPVSQVQDEARKSDAPFREILVWKFSRFTRKR
jgi:DNA invertase Pin-like site-specific DNA recombinase